MSELEANLNAIKNALRSNSGSNHFLGFKHNLYTLT